MPASKFSSNNLTPADSKYVLQIPEMSEQQILETLGYGAAIKSGGLPAAEAEFRQNHHNADPTPDKLNAVLRQTIADKETFAGMGASGITAAQAYSITTAAEHTGVPAANIAKLAIAERAFDPTFKANRQPGLIQMKPGDFAKTFAEYGGDCSRTAALHDQIPKDAAGKPEPPSEWPRDFNDKVAALQADPLASAQLGTMYAKTHPVQLDVVDTYTGETARNNQLQLGNLMRNVGELNNFQVNTAINPADPEWCAATVGSAMKAAGVAPKLETRGEHDPGKPTLLAADYENYGGAIPHPSASTVRPGDVVVFDKLPHVAMVESVDRNGNFTWVGGNQGAHRSLSHDAGDTVHDPGLTFRRPPPGVFANATSQPLPAPLALTTAPAASAIAPLVINPLVNTAAPLVTAPPALKFPQ